MNCAKIYIRDKAHYQSEWERSLKKGFELEGGIKEAPHFTPESIVYHLAERVMTPLLKDAFDTGYGKITYFEEAQIITTINDVRMPRRKNPSRALISVTKTFENMSDAMDYMEVTTGKRPKMNKIYEAIKYRGSYCKFDIRFKKRRLAQKTYVDGDSIQLTLPFMSVNN